MEGYINMEIGNNIHFTSAEMANLWTSFQNDTMAICVLKHFLKNVEDKEIQELLDYALHITTQHIETVTALMQNENFPIPHGFTENDVDLNAPRLFSDTFYLFYMNNMAKFGSNAYSMGAANVSRADIQKFYTECCESSLELLNKSTNILQRKGLYIRPPYIPTPEQVDYVQKQGFLTGWFGDRRPLNTVEIMNLFFNIQRNAIGAALLTGLSQVAKSKIIQNYIIRGKKIATKHVEIFSSVLVEDDIPAPASWDLMPTQSILSPFSDKLIMFHIAALNAAGVGYYGASLGASQRRDLGGHYTRLSAEVLQYAEDGANMMIDNAWMEQPPTAPDREALISSKK
jgi:hypothetical protein